MTGLSNLLIPAVLFFALGFLARLVRSDLRFPADLAKVLSIYLLVAIGLHGGVELAKADLAKAAQAVLWAVVLGLALPVAGYAALVMTRRVARLDAAAIAAHYGSVSAGTFLTAVAYLQSAGIPYETYPVIMLAVMESPAIIIGLLLAARARRTAAGGGAAVNHVPAMLREALTNGSVLLLVGSMVIGAVATAESVARLKPFIDDIFMGALCLFLLEMGMEAGRRIEDFKRVGATLSLFAVLMPLAGGAVGATVGHGILGFGVGGTLLVAVLGASASYIAVPPAMRIAVPEANPSFYLTMALGITFPFNVLVGIPLYRQFAEWLAGG